MPKILVIDDSSVNNYLLENILIDHGYTLQIAYNAYEAFDLLKADKPDLILLDLMMPEVDGFQMLEKLQKQSEFKDIPVIIVTAKNELTDKKKALDLGITDYVIKPINIDFLLKKVEEKLQQVS